MIIFFPRAGSWSVSFAMDGGMGVWPLDDEEALKDHSFDEEGFDIRGRRRSEHDRGSGV